MNFELMPELHWPFGYPLISAIMIAIGAGIPTWFRGRGCPGNGDRR